MKETKKEMEKIFPAEIILRGERYYPEEYFNPNIKRDIFNCESVDLENLYIIGTHAEGRDFLGKITSQGKIKKWNEYRTWQKTLCFKPVYDEDIILVGESWIEIAENPVSYFLLEEA